MSFDTFAELLANDTIVAAEDIELVESVKEKQLVTPLFTVTFHNMEIAGTIVDGANGLFLGDLFNLADRVVVRVATAIVNAQELLFGLEAVATGSAKSIVECFNEDLTLKPEYCAHLDDAKIKQAVAYAAEIQAYMKTLYALIAERERLIPMARRKLQLAWNSEKQEAVTDLKEALAYRIATGSTKKSAIKRWNEQKNSKGKVVNNLTKASLADLLG